MATSSSQLSDYKSRHRGDAMKILALALLFASACGCTLQTVRPSGPSESNAAAVKSMTMAAIKSCGRGNVKSVTVTGFECMK